MKTTILNTTKSSAALGRCSMWLNANNPFFSELIEKEVSNQQVLSLINLMISFALLASLIASAWFVVLLLFTYFVVSAHSFVKSGILKENSNSMLNNTK